MFMILDLHIKYTYINFMYYIIIRYTYTCVSNSIYIYIYVCVSVYMILEYWKETNILLLNVIFNIFEYH